MGLGVPPCAMITMMHGDHAWIPCAYPTQAFKVLEFKHNPAMAVVRHPHVWEPAAMGTMNPEVLVGPSHSCALLVVTAYL